MVGGKSILKETILFDNQLSKSVNYTKFI